MKCVSLLALYPSTHYQYNMCILYYQSMFCSIVLVTTEQIGIIKLECSAFKETKTRYQLNKYLHVPKGALYVTFGNTTNTEKCTYGIEIRQMYRHFAGINLARLDIHLLIQYNVKQKTKESPEDFRTGLRALTRALISS